MKIFFHPGADINRAIAEAAGLRVHLYTSPHLVRFHERIRLAGELVGEAALSDALEHVERINAGDPITVFEVTTAVAFHLFATVPAESITPQHYAFLLSEEEFDVAFGKIRSAGVAYFADPHGRLPGEINHNDGGRGVYFTDPAGHGMEIITRPYGYQEPAATGR